MSAMGCSVNLAIHKRVVAVIGLGYAVPINGAERYMQASPSIEVNAI